MHEQQQHNMTLLLFILYLNSVSGCELLGRFDMPGLYKRGDLMIGGIFPVFEKEIRSTSTFKSKPPEVKCVG